MKAVCLHRPIGTGAPFSKVPVIFLSDRLREVVFFVFRVHVQNQGVTSFEIQMVKCQEKKQNGLVFELHSHCYSLDLYFEICFGSVK